MQRRSILIAAAAGGILPARPALSQGNDIVLGHTGILGGPLGVPVTTMLAGANLAFDEVNRQGGIGGRRIRVKSIDDELKPDKAVANYRQLLAEDNVLAFFGCVGSGTTAAAAGVLKTSGAPLVGGFAVADSARDKVLGSAYFIRATTGREAQALVQHLTTVGITRIAVARLDNPGGLEALKLLSDALSAHTLSPLASGAVKGDASNAPDLARTLAAAQPQAVIMYLGGALGGELMKGMWAVGSHPSFYGMSIVPGEVIARVIGEGARGLAISQITPYPWNEVDPVVKTYRQLCAAGKVPVGYYSFEGYLSALVMSDALRRAGRSATRAQLHGALRATRLRLAGMGIDFTHGGHTGSRFVELVQVTRDGRFVR